jgi:hypothetical protein
MTVPHSQQELALGFYRNLFGGENPRLGEAVVEAKRGAGDWEVRRTWILLGDPTMKMR